MAASFVLARIAATCCLSIGLKLSNGLERLIEDCRRVDPGDDHRTPVSFSPKCKASIGVTVLLLRM